MSAKQEYASDFSWRYKWAAEGRLKPLAELLERLSATIRTRFPTKAQRAEADAINRRVMGALIGTASVQAWLADRDTKPSLQSITAQADTLCLQLGLPSLWLSSQLARAKIFHWLDMRLLVLCPQLLVATAPKTQQPDAFRAGVASRMHELAEDYADGVFESPEEMIDELMAIIAKLQRQHSVEPPPAGRRHRRTNDKADAFVLVRIGGPEVRLSVMDAARRLIPGADDEGVARRQTAAWIEEVDRYLLLEPPTLPRRDGP